MTQHPVLESFSKVRSAARVAASKTSSTPSPVRALHSKYLLAPICLPILSACCCITNGRDFFRISSLASGSSRRSFFRPTRINGTPAHRSWASGTHYSAQLVSVHFARRHPYLILHIFQGIRRIDSISYQNHMRF